MCCTGLLTFALLTAPQVRRPAKARSCPVGGTEERALQFLNDKSYVAKRARGLGDSARLFLFDLFCSRFLCIHGKAMLHDLANERSRQWLFFREANGAFVRGKALKFMLEFLYRCSAHGKK